MTGYKGMVQSKCWWSTDAKYQGRVVINLPDGGAIPRGKQVVASHIARIHVFALLKKIHVGVGAVDGHPIRRLSGIVQMVGFPWVSCHFQKEQGKPWDWVVPQLRRWWTCTLGWANGMSHYVVTSNYIEMCHSNLYVQEVKSGRTPTDVEVYMQGHRGSDPQNPDVLCTQTATDRLVSFWYSIMCLILFARA